MSSCRSVRASLPGSSIETSVTAACAARQLGRQAGQRRCSMRERASYRKRSSRWRAGPPSTTRRASATRFLRCCRRWRAARGSMRTRRRGSRRSRPPGSKRSRRRRRCEAPVGPEPAEDQRLLPALQARQREALELLAGSPTGIADAGACRTRDRRRCRLRLARHGYISLRHDRIDRDPFAVAAPAGQTAVESDDRDRAGSEYSGSDGPRSESRTRRRRDS